MTMTTTKNGTPIIKRKFKGIGRIFRRAGTDSDKTRREIGVMMDTMYRQGQWKFLEALRDGKVSFLELLEKWATGKLNGFTLVEDIRPVKVVFSEWLDKVEGIAPETIKSYRSCGNVLFATARDDAVMSDLPAIVAAYRESCKTRCVEVQFNTTRAVVRSFVSHTIGIHNQLYGQVSDIKPLPHQTKRNVNGLSVAEVYSIMEKLPEEFAMMTLTLALTGCGWKEYQTIEILADRVLVHGMKMKRIDARRDRIIPRIGNPVKPSCSQQTFSRKLKEAGGDDVFAYRLRHTFAYWMNEAGINQVRREQYMGHAPATMTAHYTRTEQDKHIAEDGKLLSAWLAAETAKL